MSFLSIWEELTGEKVEPDRAELDSLGLNHLTWHRGFRIDGIDVWDRLFPAILEREAALPAAGTGSVAANAAAGQAPARAAASVPVGAKGAAGGEWDRSTLETLGMVPNYYLQYYYYTSRKLAEQQAWPPSRAEAVMAIERDLLALYSDPGLVAPPPELMQRGGAWYSELATRVIDDHWNDRGRVHVVNVRNDGAVPSWPADWVLELPASVDRRGARPLPARPLEGAPAGLVAQVKAYELLTVEAAVRGDRRAAREALLAHPLGPEADRISAFLDDMLETNRKHLPRFFA
jgi:6-phospho-beta-glucosidase